MAVKNLALIALVAVGLLAVAGCGSSDTSSAPPKLEQRPQDTMRDAKSAKSVNGMPGGGAPHKKTP